MRAPVLLDQYGRPIRRAALKREVAAPSTTGVRSILPTHQSSGMTPDRVAALLQEANTPGAGSAVAYMELAEHMEEVDLHYVGVLQTRKRQVAQIGVAVEPASDSASDVADADLARAFLGRRAIVDELIDLLDALGKGYAVAEIMWETSERQWMPSRLERRDPRWFEFDRETGRRLMLRGDAGEPVPLDAGKFVSHVVSAKSGLPIRGGLARIAVWAWLFKSLTLKDWTRFVEAYGQPIRLGRYGPNASPEDLETLERAVANVAADAAALVPEGMSIEFVADTTVRGRSEVYRDLIEYVDKQLSIAVLGQTLTTDSGATGSYALGQVHNLVRSDIEASDAAQLEETLERDLVRPIVALNHGPRAAYPAVRIERQTAHDAKATADVLAALVPLGLRVRMADVRDRLGFEPPAQGDEVLSGPPPASALAKAKARAKRDDDPLAAVIDAIDGGTWQSLAAPLVEPVLRRAVADPDGLLDDIANVYPEMDADDLTERLARILFVADVAGRELAS